MSLLRSWSVIFALNLDHDLAFFLPSKREDASVSYCKSNNGIPLVTKKYVFLRTLARYQCYSK